MRKMVSPRANIVFWLALLQLFASVSRLLAAPAYQPPSQAEAEDFAKTFLAAVAKRDTNQSSKMYDLELLVARALDGMPTGSKNSDALLRGVKDGLMHSILNELTAPGITFELLRWKQDGGDSQIVVRQFIEAKGIFDYWHLTLAKRPDGTVKIIDNRTMFTGENASDLIRRTLMPAMADLNKNAFQRLVSEQSEFVKAMPQWSEFSKLFNEKRFEEALAVYAKIPPAVRNMKFIQVQRVLASGSQGPEEHLLAIDHYARLFPNDPSVPFHSFFANLGAKKYQEALANLDQLDRLFSPDLFLSYLRARVYSLMNNPEGAVRAARESVAAATLLDFKAKYYLELLFKAKSYEDATAFLAALEAKNRAEMLGPALALPGASDFLRSPAVRRWAQSPAKLPVPAQLQGRIDRAADAAATGAATRPAAPPAGAPPAAAPAVPAPPVPAYKLGGILYSKKNPAAIINGKTLYVGDRVGEAKVTAIEQQSVTLDINGKGEVLNLK